jgi:hypothetical protein
MALNIKDAEPEQFAAEVAALASERRQERSRSSFGSGGLG